MDSNFKHDVILIFSTLFWCHISMDNILISFTWISYVSSNLLGSSFSSEKLFSTAVDLISFFLWTGTSRLRSQVLCSIHELRIPEWHQGQNALFNYVLFLCRQSGEGHDREFEHFIGSFLYWFWIACIYFQILVFYFLLGRRSCVHSGLLYSSVIYFLFCCILNKAGFYLTLVHIRLNSRFIFKRINFVFDKFQKKKKKRINL